MRGAPPRSSAKPAAGAAAAGSAAGRGVTSSEITIVSGKISGSSGVDVLDRATDGGKATGRATGGVPGRLATGFTKGTVAARAAAGTGAPAPNLNTVPHAGQRSIVTPFTCSAVKVCSQLGFGQGRSVGMAGRSARFVCAARLLFLELTPHASGATIVAVAQASSLVLRRIGFQSSPLKVS